MVLLLERLDPGSPRSTLEWRLIKTKQNNKNRKCLKRLCPSWIRFLLSDLDRKAWWCLMVSSSYVDESLRLRGSCLLGSSGPELRGMSMLLRLRWRLPSRVGEDGGARTLLMTMPGDRRSVSWDR